MSEKYYEHYKKYIPAYENLSMCNGGKTVWIPTDSHSGWYNTSLVQDEDSKAWKNGFSYKSEPSILPDDLSADVERSAYTTISYALDEDYETAFYKEKEDGVEWMDDFSDRLPDYEDIVSWALFVDIDIDKRYKKRPLPEEHKELIESRVENWIKAFSSMAGGVEHVFVLDSGGGVYVFTPPAGLAPVADRYDKEKRGLIFNEIAKRMRKVTGELDELICNEDSTPQELFSADKVQNKNRQYKTVGSIHKDLDAVVTPCDPQNFRMKHTSISDVTEEDISEAIEWSESFTSDKHRECVSSIIEYLFQGAFTKRESNDIEPIEGNTWEEILDNWVEDELERVKMWEEKQKKRDELSDIILNTELTQDKEISQEAIRRVNNQKLKSYIVEYVGVSKVYEKSGSEEMDFYPFWRGSTSESGRSAFYDYYEGQARFTDKADGTSRDIVYWIALEMTYDNKNYPNTKIIESPGETLSGYDYRLALQELRNRGESIPILVSNASESNPLSETEIKNIGIELGIVSDEDILHSGNKLKPDAWNNVLNKLEEEGIEHYQEKRTPLKPDQIKPPTDKNSGKTLDDLTLDKFRDSYSGLEKKWQSVDLDSFEEYNEFIRELPKYVVPFMYEGEILGNEAEGIFLGKFISQNPKENEIVMSQFEPYPLQNHYTINSADDLEIKKEVTLDTSKMSILVEKEWK